jgi:perosamine synthetase
LRRQGKCCQKLTKNYNEFQRELFYPREEIVLIPINKPQLDEREREEILLVLEEGNLTSPAMDGGKRVREFEELLKSYLKVRNVVAVNSGTSALHSALLAAGIGHGDEVILPSFTFVATANAVMATGAKPVFIDILQKDYTADPIDIKRKITDKTKAIIPVHLYGHPASMNPILEIGEKHSLLVIEDACQSLGSSYLGRQTGSIGNMGCFSLYASKVLTAGEGGAIATDDDDLANELRMIRNHGMVKGYDTRVLGLNMRLPEISAAIAKVQMQKLPRILELRRRNAKILHELLGGVNRRLNIGLPIEPDGLRYNWYLYTVTINNKRDDIKNQLNKAGIGATVYYDPPVHMTPYYSAISNKARLENTELASKNVLSLPVHQSLTEEDTRFIANKAVEAMNN